MNKIIFSHRDIKKQLIYDNNFWNVIFPNKPVFPYHLIIAVKDENKKIFTDLSDVEVVSLKDCIDKIQKTMRQNFNYTFEGYNLFSNNGSKKIGQSVDQFHQHIFIRLSDEAVSPYDLLNSGEKWFDINNKNWLEQKNKICQIILNPTNN